MSPPRIRLGRRRRRRRAEAVLVAVPGGEPAPDIPGGGGRAYRVSREASRPPSRRPTTAAPSPPGRSRSSPRCQTSSRCSRFLAARGDLRQHRPLRPCRRRRRHGRPRPPRACRCAARSCNDGGAGGQAGDPVAGDELEQVAPVRADLGGRGEGPPSVASMPPVVIRGAGAASPAGTRRARWRGAPASPAASRARSSRDHGKEAVDERHRGDPFAGRAHQGHRLGAPGGERLLADHVHASGERGGGRGGVRRVGRADVQYRRARRRRAASPGPGTPDPRRPRGPPRRRSPGGRPPRPRRSRRRGGPPPREPGP